MSLFLTRPPRTGLAFVAHMLCRHRRPRAWLSSLSFVPADSQTDREVPTPLLFLSAPRWTGDQPASQLYAPWLEHLKKHGFSALFLDLDPELPTRDPANVLQVMEKDMAAALRSPAQSAAGIQPPPFPPALIAYGAACPIAEAYASSYPLSALQLINPPVSMERAKQRYPHLFGGSNIREFDFEATFPVRVTWTPDELAWQAQQQIPWYEVHRIEHQREDAADESLDRYEWDSFEHGVQDTVCWLEDEAGL